MCHNLGTTNSRDLSDPSLESFLKFLLNDVFKQFISRQKKGLKPQFLFDPKNAIFFLRLRAKLT